MAKTTSQIVAENKIKRAQEAAVVSARKETDKQQLSAVPNSAAKTKAVLAKAMAGTTDEKRKAETERAYKSVIAQENEQKKSAADQMWERGSNAPKETEFDGYRKQILDLQRQLSDAENAEIDWTSAADRQENARQQKELQEQIDRARDEMNYRANAGKIDSMGEEQKQDLETLAKADNGFLSWMNIWDDQKALKALQNPEENEYAQRFGAEQRLVQSGIGKQQLQGLAETYQRDMNRRDAEQAMEESRQRVESGTGGAVAENVAAFGENLLGGITGTLETADQTLRRAMGKSIYSTADTNRPGYRLSQKAEAAREATSEQILGDDPTLLRKGANLLYKGGTSAIDNVLRGLAGGGTVGSLALAGMGSFQDSYRSAVERGAGDETALLYGSVTAALEVATEFLPTEHLLGAKNAKECESILKRALVQAGLEIPGEEISLWGEIVADAYIMGDKSENNRLRAELIANGYSKEQADDEVMRRNLMQSAETAMTTLISSGISTVAQGKVDAVSDRIDSIGKDTLNTENSVVENAPLTEQQMAQKSVEDTAREMGQKVTPADPEVKTQEQSNLDRAIMETMGAEPDAPDSITQNNEAKTAETPVETAPIGSAQQEDIQNMSANDGQQHGMEGIKGTGAEETDTTGMQNTPSGDFKDSKTFTNTGLNSADEGIRAGYQETVEQDPFSPKYEVKHNADTSATAQERTSTPERVRSEYNYLMGKNEAWTAEDVVTARLATKELLKLGEADKTAEINIRLKEVLSNMGQSIQAASITGTMQDAADSATAVETATNRIFDMKQEDSTFQQKKDGKTYQQWQKETAVNIARIGSEIEKVQDGDAGAMRAIIRQIARDRKTTAWFGMSDRMSGIANRILNKLDFDTLKKIANTQIAAMPGDFKKRTKTDIMLGIRKQNMLTSLKTFNRNISGNTAVGLVDSASDSTAGHIADLILSQVTGKKTVGSDIAHGKAYLDAAKSAGEFASLCVELNIPIETDIDSSYGSVSGDGGGRYIGKTFRSQGNFAMRAMYAYQKYMSYALEVTDKIFEGGTNAAVAESLGNLKNSGLSDTDIQELSEYTANRRTFKDATWEDSRGKHGSTLSGVTQNLKNIGEGTAVGKPIKVAADMIIPFASVPMNVAQTGIDYTAGTVKGLTEMISIARDAKAGKEISAVRQRKAVTDFGRGITGTAMIGLLATAAAKGIIRVSNAKDKDEKALAQAEGRTGAQINWDAAKRSLDGESEEWMDGDTISGLDFLEPFDTQMYLACELAQEDTMQGVLKALPGATVRSVFNSFMDSPAMTGLSNIEDLISDFSEAETAEDALGAAAGYAGNLATSFIPQVVRQAAQNMDGYYRDARGAGNLEYAKNNIMAAIPGMSQELPKKISGLGEEQQRGNWMETFFDPTATKTYRKNEITGYLDELSGRTGDKTIYPDRQAPMRITGADGRTIELDGEKRETYQRVYGEKVNYYYTGLYNNSDFQNLPDDLKIAALGKAKEYATGHAKAAVSDYHDEKEKKSGDFVKKIVTDVTVSAIADIFNDMDTAKEYGYDNQQNIDRLEDAYDQYAGMTKDERSRVMEKAAGDTEKYLEIRDKGVSTDTYIRAIKRVSAQTVQPGYTKIRPAQELTAIAGTPGATDKTIDILMKAYMTDYDPNAKKPDTTELKYDYARKELGYSPKQYALGYDIYSHEKSVGGDGTADRTRERLEKELGISKKDAKKLYSLLNGNWKPWNE